MIIVNGFLHSPLGAFIKRAFTYKRVKKSRLEVPSDGFAKHPSGFILLKPELDASEYCSIDMKS